MNDWVEILETALYGSDVVERDRAAQSLHGHLGADLVKELVLALDSPTRLTRRRSGRILSSLPTKYTHPVVRKSVESLDTPNRILIGLARVMTATTPEPDPVFTHGLTHSDASVRRAFATAAAPTDALLNALLDEDEEVVSRAAQVCLTREVQLPDRIYARMNDVLQAPAALIRLVAAQGASGQSLLHQWGDRGSIAAMEYNTDPHALMSLFETEPASAAWALLAAGHGPPEGWHAHGDHRIRGALARYLPRSSQHWPSLLEDPDPSVRWFAEQRESGRYDARVLEGRQGLGPRLDSPSLKPPYGLREGDVVPSIPRAHAALAICQARFDINLGVAVRSAEAAGFREVLFVGRGDYLKSPARGADLAIPVRHIQDPAALVRYARNADYQLVAVQQTATSVPYHEANYPPRPLFIVGSEDVGMPALLRKRADMAVEIPQFGVIDSLNVAAASTVVMFHWRVHYGSVAGHT